MKKIVFTISICFLFLSGCGRIVQNDLSQVRVAEGGSLQTGKSDKERAQSIKENIMEMEELEGAAVVVESHTALIGLRVKEKWQKEDIRLKTQAGQLAKEADAYINGTAITTNEKIIKMIESLERE